MSLVLALLSAIVLGSADFVGGMAARRARALAVVICSNSVGLVGAAAMLIVLPAAFRLGDIGWGLLAGLCGSVGAVLLYRALAVGVMSLVAPTTAASAAVLPVAAAMATGQRLTATAALGVGCALASVVLITRGRDAGRDPSSVVTRGLVLAVLAGMSFGGFLVLLAPTSPDSGLWPLVGARCAALAVLLTVACHQRQPLLVRGPARRLSALAGALDMVANVLFLLALRTGELATVGLLASLSPLGTVLLARVMLRERLHLRQGIGATLAMVSVVLFAVRP